MTSKIGGPILVIGDSLVASAEDELHAAGREHGIELDVRAEPGRSIAAATPILGATNRAAQIVIALGTNDVGAAATTLDGLISHVLAAADGRHVWWLDVGLADFRRAAHVNEAIERAGRGSAKLHLIRWSRRVSADPDLLSADGVHLSSAGRTAFAATMVGALHS